MSRFNKQLTYISIPYLLCFLVGMYFVAVETKKALHLEVNEHHNQFFDVFFKYVTHLGDGLMFGVVIILSFFRNKMAALTFSISGVLTLLLVFFFKKIVFAGSPRPIEFIGEANLHLVEGVKMAHWNAFPSGHTTAAFAIATVLILYAKNKWLQVFFMLLALLAGFSRVYLSQHFVEDILAGSVLGIFIGIVSFKLTDLIKKRKQ